MAILGFRIGQEAAGIRPLRRNDVKVMIRSESTRFNNDSEEAIMK